MPVADRLIYAAPMPDPLTSTPRADGFRMPGEFEPHAGVWMSWPTRPDNWRDDAAPAQAAFARVAAAIHEATPVTMGAAADQLDRARAALPAGVRVVELASDDAWMRDVGPTFVTRDGELRGVDWIFNAWGGPDGGLYDSWDADDAVAAAICEAERAPRYRAPFVLEGGAIHVDGEGTLLTTEECLLNPNRNPGMSREQIEDALGEHLGVRTVLWLGAGAKDDETDGHVDNLACFARPGVVLVTGCDDPADPQHAISADAIDRLRGFRDARGRELEVVQLPMPGPLFLTAQEAAGVVPVPGSQPRRAGDRLAGSYANFLITNGRVVVPLLDERTDDAALEVLAGVFPDHEVVGVPGCREILLGGGNIHCITQQVPAT
jgi:agmatine deiminase